ncbi:hypothetical protein [Modestobacter excelsi]|uniref:hypothetical protein n=1 Tax=Modestobacter excelsi TaxID=2213161 RepID=UPI00110CFE05|nr:hypothetical protein [Modestobacter excelsi]
MRVGTGLLQQRVVTPRELMRSSARRTGRQLGSVVDAVLDGTFPVPGRPAGAPGIAHRPSAS